MKLKIIVATAITALFLTYACDEKYEPREYDDYYYVPIVSTFFAGDKDSCTYYDYEPDILLSSEYLNKGYFDYSQTIDIDEDGIDDFEININGYKDGANTLSNYWRTIYLRTLNDFHISYDWIMDSDSGNNNYTTQIYGPAALHYSDTIINFGYSNAYNNKFQLIETGYNFETNSFDTCCGLWNTWGEDRYIAFLKIDDDTTLGWMRLELSAESDHIILKDGAIQKFSEKRNK
jgi:hypothetical protein